jgi:uncharacterized membrane protein YsdA (DUF1294 family)
MNGIDIIKYYLLLLNIIGFALMGIDKERAKKRKWRIKEKNLFLVAFIGGSIGSILGMQFFRHKTKQMKFTIGMPLILVLHVSIIGLVIKFLM